jgi:hypothetical protein
MTHVHVLSISAIPLILSVTTVDGQPTHTSLLAAPNPLVTQVPEPGDLMHASELCRNSAEHEDRTDAG